MMFLKRFYRARFFVLLLVTIFTQFLMKGECLSLDIQNERQTFIFREGEMSEIIFYPNNIPDGITLYVFKDGQNKNPPCKLVLTQTTCLKNSGSCQCAPTSKEGRIEFTFLKQFHVQDSGVWVFEVWDKNVSKHVNISVQGNTTESTTENAADRETTNDSTNDSPARSDVISIAIIVIATVVIVIAISSIIVVLCRPRFVMRAAFCVFMKTRGLQHRQSHVSSAQSSQSSVSHDRRPADEDVSQHDSKDAHSSIDGSLKEGVAFDNRKSNDTDTDIIKETATLPPSPPLSQQTVDTTPAQAPALRPKLKPPPPPTLPQLGLALPLQKSAPAPRASAPAPPPKPAAALQPTPTDEKQQLQVSRASAKPPRPSPLGLDRPASESAPAPASAPRPLLPSLPPKARGSQPASPAASGRQIPQAPKPSKTSIPLQPLHSLNPPANESETALTPKAPAPPPKPPELEQLSREPPLVQSAAVKLLQEPVDPVSRIRALTPPLLPRGTQVSSPETQATNKPAVARNPQQVPLLPPDESTPVLPRRAPAPPLAPATPPKPPPTSVAPSKPPPLPVSPPKAPPQAPPPKPPVARKSPECKEQWLPLQL